MISLATSNFLRNRKRYRIILLTLAFAAAALIVMIGLLEGVQNSVREKAIRYFGGELTLQYFAQRTAIGIPDLEGVLKTIDDLPFQPRQVSLRTSYLGSDATLFFAGAYVTQRRLAGVDWDRELETLEGLHLVGGSLPKAESIHGDELVISSAVADQLGVVAGDEIILSLTTRRGRRNTVQLIVTGIFEEHSFFGYQAYMTRALLNNALERPQDEVTEIGIRLPSSLSSTAAAGILRSALRDHYYVMPTWRTRADRSAALAEMGPADGNYGIMTLEAQLDELNNLLNALGTIAGIAVGAFLVIVVIGVSNTYAMITHERIREIGTLRALGVTRFGILRLILTEAGIMGAFACSAGIPIGFILLEVLRRSMDLTGHPWAVLFLVQGKIPWSVPAIWPVLTIGVMVGAAAIGCLKPAYTAAFRLQAADALQHS